MASEAAVNTTTTTELTTELFTEGSADVTGEKVGDYIMYRVTVWVQLIILILGLITNPLILKTLRNKQIGSKCRIYTLFLYGYCTFSTITIPVTLGGFGN